jgi:hypothetical protein
LKALATSVIEYRFELAWANIDTIMGDWPPVNAGGLQEEYKNYFED